MDRKGRQGIANSEGDAEAQLVSQVDTEVKDLMPLLPHRHPFTIIVWIARTGTDISDQAAQQITGHPGGKRCS